MRPEESFVGQPIRSLQTMLRVISKQQGIIPSIIPDGIYGNDTRNTVIKFQQRHGLPGTGVVDQRTWELIVEEYEDAEVFINKAEPLEIIMDPNTVYISGDYSPNLIIAQSILYYLSKEHSTISAPSRDGYLDDPTAASIRSFQKISGLPETGNLDKKTWRHLSRQYTLNSNV